METGLKENFVSPTSVGKRKAHQCDQIRQNFATSGTKIIVFWQFLKTLFIIWWQHFEPTLTKNYAIGYFSTAEMAMYREII